ncbi:hypothetical protein HQ520_14360 [bacterium]|nr:hypothetical protein [bacterium]
MLRKMAVSLVTVWVVLSAFACGPEKMIGAPVAMEDKPMQTHATLLIEAEGFQFPGGWNLANDPGALGGFPGGTGIMQGPGVAFQDPNAPPVKPTPDAVTVVALPASGMYHVWARARDYLSIPKSRRYTIAIDGEAMPKEAGDHGADGWAWQEVGQVSLDAGDHLIGLRDTTGFFPRCDAVLLTTIDQNPNSFSLDEVAAYRTEPETVESAGKDILEPVKLRQGKGKTLATIDNGLTRIVFQERRDAEGEKAIVRRTSIRDGKDWLEISGGEEEALFLLYATACEAELKLAPKWNTPENLLVFEVAGKTVEAAPVTNNPFYPGVPLRLKTISVRKTGPAAIEATYEAVGEKGILAGNRAVATWSLEPDAREAKFEMALTPAKTGYFMAGMCAFDSWEKENVEFVQLPPLYQYQRLPNRPLMVTSSLTPHPLALVQVKPEGMGDRDISFAAIAEMGRLPYRWSNSTNMIYGFSLLNTERRAQPAVFMPVMGAEGSKWEAGEAQSVAWRLLAYPGDWKQTLEYYSQEIAEVTDFRKPIEGSLTEAVFNMQKLMMHKDGGWHPRMKGFYDIETPAMGKQGAPLALIEAAMISRNEKFWAERALPTIEFTLRSRDSAVIWTGKDHYGKPFSGQFRVPSMFYDTSYWQGVQSLLGGVNPWLREFALPGGHVYQSKNYNTAPTWSPLMAKYRMEPSPELLEQIKKEADEFLEKEIYGRQTEPKGFDLFYNIHYIPYWWELIDLYELTGEKRYLDAAEEGAFHMIAGLWSIPQTPQGEIQIHPSGQEPTWMPVWSRDNKPYRLGWPRQENDTPAKNIEAWKVSPIGMGLETPGTFTTHPQTVNNIIMANWAPHLLRVYRHTGRDIYRTYARHSVIGRYTNYPGYYVSSLTDVFHTPDYPYTGPDLTSIYYHHIPVHFGFTVDYLVAQAEVRSNGKVRFPYAKQKNYAWFDERMYGLEPGEIFGEKGAVLWIEEGVAKPENIMVDWIAARSADRFYLMLMSQADEPMTVQPNLDAKKIGLADGDIRIYVNGKAEASVMKSLSEKSVTIPPKGMITLSMPAQPKETPPTVPPLENGHVVTNLAPWGELHTFRIRSPFGKDSIFTVLISDPVQGASAKMNVRIAEKTRTLQVPEWPYEFSISPLTIGEPVTFDFTIGGIEEKPDRTVRVTMP